MFSLDTNVLVRLLVDDPGAEGQCHAARRAVETAEEVFVGQVVQVETVWVLKRAYGLSKPNILRILEQLQNNHAFVLDQRDIFDLAVAIFRETQAEFSDAVVLAVSRTRKTSLLTFDRRLLKLEGDHAPLLEAFFKASNLPDPDTLIAALKCGDLQVASHKSFMLALHTNNTFDAARASFLSALEGLATALAYEEANPNAMWCALLLVHGDMAKCEMYLNFLESPECSKQLPNCLASPAQAGSKGGEQKSRNLLLLQTMLSLLLYQRRPDNGWKNPTQVAKELKAPLQQFFKENKIKTLGANDKFDIEETILRWIDDDARVKLAFQKTKHDQSA